MAVETFNDTRKRLEQFIKEAYPEVDLAPGTVLSELLIKLSATVQNQQYNEIAQFRAAQSINETLANGITDPDVLDNIASNFMVTRKTGTKAAGLVRMTVSSDRSYTVPATFTMVQPSTGLKYTVEAGYTVSARDSRAAIKLLPYAADTGNTLWYFILPMVAADVGSEYFIQDGTILVPDETNSALTAFVGAKAYGNFSSGSDAETNQDLVARIKGGLSTKTLTSPIAIKATLEDLFNVTNMSVVGAGDPEMLRSKYNILSMDSFGMADVYVRSAVSVESLIREVVLAKTEGGWVADLDDMAGVHRVTSVLPVSGGIFGTYPIVGVQWTAAYPAAGRRNYLPDDPDGFARCARFSKYQHATVTVDNQNPGFISDPAYPKTRAANAPVGAVDRALVTMDYLPNIARIQDLFIDGAMRIPCADYLVKSVVPCFVDIDLSVDLRNFSGNLDVLALKTDLMAYVNGLDFGQPLVVSRLVDIVHDYNVRHVFLPLNITGSIPTIAGGEIQIDGSDLLEIPLKPQLGVSPNTTMFFANLGNINITTVNA